MPQCTAKDINRSQIGRALSYIAQISLGEDKKQRICKQQQHRKK